MEKLILENQVLIMKSLRLLLAQESQCEKHEFKRKGLLITAKALSDRIEITEERIKHTV